MQFSRNWRCSRERHACDGRLGSPGIFQSRDDGIRGRPLTQTLPTETPSHSGRSQTRTAPSWRGRPWRVIFASGDAGGVGVARATAHTIHPRYSRGFRPEETHCSPVFASWGGGDLSGQRWRAILANAGLQDREIFSVVIDPSNSSPFSRNCERRCAQCRRGEDWADLGKKQHSFTAFVSDPRDRDTCTSVP